jgi:2-haloacid dehalogenase
MTTPKQKHVVFDVVGTCVSFSAYFDKIDRTIGPKLRVHNITPQMFGYSWMTASELEFTFLSISERYKPYKDVLKALFYRTLWMAGAQDPKSIATEEERDMCIQGYSELELRPGLKQCFAKLREEGFTVWCLTTGDVKRVRGYFERGRVEMPMENFISCDAVGLAKPALAAYRPALEQFAEQDQKWFAAAHMWDVSAAVKVGFRGAYCTIYEQDPCEELFGEDKMDVIADSLLEMAEKIVQASL